jgi:SAM-dependent MidA family methyltransferase
MIGRTGDFYTSPHLHSIFGAMLGRQMEEMWIIIGKPDIFHVVEMGAGMGYLAKDMLEYLNGKGRRAKSREEKFFEHVRYTIVELNPAVRAKQQELLSEFSDKVKWVSHINELKPITGCFLSNELLDAFPVRLIEMSDNGLKEIYVSMDGNDLVEVKMPCSAEVKEYFNEFDIKLPEGYKTEVNLKIKDWLSEVGNKLSEGFILTIDYGYPAQDYYSEDRNRGTLLCYYHHQINENPYQNIGEQDLTAHVNFSSLKKWGNEVDLKTLGFCPQGAYFVSLGIDEVIIEFYGDSPDVFDVAKIKGLIMPQGMGESHKVMIQYKGKDEPKLKGFLLRNQLKYL